MYIDRICIALLRVCVIRYQQEDSEHGGKPKRLKLLAHRHIIWGLESNPSFALDVKRCTDLPQPVPRCRPYVVTRYKARDAQTQAA